MKSKLNILVLSDFFFPDSMGGANKIAYYTSQGLASRGHHVSLITRRTRKELPDNDTIHGIEVYRYDLPKKTFINFNIYARPQIRKILGVLEKKKTSPLDLLIVHQPLIAMAFHNHRYIKEAPWLYNFHSPWGEEFKISKFHKYNGIGNPPLFLQQKIRTWIEGRVLDRCDRIIILSEFMKERLAKIHGMAHKSIIIPGCVNTDLFSPLDDQTSYRKELGLPPDKIILFTVRNLRPRMGLMNLIEAIADIAPIGIKVHLVIAGKGELTEKLKKYALKREVCDQITFTGHVPEDDLPKYYRAADLFLLPTEYLEGFGMVTMEALASGLPVIATPVGATPEILSSIGKEWLCKDSSSDALALKIKDRAQWLIQSPDRYQETRRYCRELALKSYALPKIIDQWERECNALLSHKRGEPC